MQVIHYDNSSGIDTVTACGKSLHGWNLYRPKGVTKELLKVTCKSCIAKLRRRGFSCLKKL